MTRLRNIKGKIPKAAGPTRRRRRAQQPDRDAFSIMSHDPDQELIPAISGPEISPFRHGDYMHVSDLLHKCVRQMAMADKLAAPMQDQVIHSSQAVTFELGHAVENFVTRRLKTKSAGILHGTFVCNCIDEKVKFVGTYKQAKRRKECPGCGHKPLNYKELTLINEELKLVGNVDYALIEHDHFVLCELKSIADKGWQELERPMPVHTVQILMYWWMARELGIPIYDKVCVLYVNKQYLFGKSPFKEFVLQPSLEMRKIEEYLDDARAYKEYRETGVLPTRLQCPHINYTKAKQCHVSNECFEYEPTSD